MSADASLLVDGILMNPANPEAGEEREAFFDPGRSVMTRMRLQVILCHRIGDAPVAGSEWFIRTARMRMLRVIRPEAGEDHQVFD